MHHEIEDPARQPGMTVSAPRVLLVGQGAPARGGIPTFIQGLLDDPALRAGARLSLLNTARDVARPGRATIDNAWWALQDVSTLFKRARRVDVVHLHLAPVPLLPLTRAIILLTTARLAGARTLLHAHSGRLHTAARSRSFRIGLRVLGLLADRTIAVSADGLRALERVGARAELLANGLDTGVFPEPERDPAVVSIVFVGTVCDRKGLDDLRVALMLLRDAARLAHARVTIVGDGRQEGPNVFEHVQESYENSDLTDIVRFTGALPPAEVRSILTKADIFCLPSHWEGLPLSVLEAMAAGAAVVATTVGEIPHVLEQGKAGILIEPRQPAQLADALGRLLDDPVERARLGTVARDRVRRDYDRATMTQRILEIYRELAYSI
jgi:glycosyltransferase involved in cell wall biosynthesis